VLDYDPVLEAEGVLEDPQGEIGAPLAGVGRRFFETVAEVDEVAADLLKDTRRYFEYTAGFSSVGKTNSTREEEELQLLLFTEDDLIYRGCRIARPILALAAETAQVDEVGIVDCRDDSLLLLVHHAAFKSAGTLWSKGELDRARIRLRLLVGWEQQT